ncbi:hypothetical protein ACFE04_005638 [Oxalis oulophora]
MPRKPCFVETPSPILHVPNLAPVAPSHIVPPRVHVLCSTHQCLPPMQAIQQHKIHRSVCGLKGTLALTFQHFQLDIAARSKYPKAKFHFDDSDKSFEKYVIRNIGTKWKDNRGRLFRQFYDSSLSRAHNITHGPKGIDQDQWTMYVNYRLEPRTEKKGAEIINRGTLWPLTHKRKHDGQYVNLKAEKIAQKIISIEKQDENARILSSQDSLGQVFGSEHNGRVRGMSFGPIPTQIAGKRSAFGVYIINCVNDGKSYLKKFIVRCYEVGINKTTTVETMANLFQESDVENA